ncbi:thiolase family protein [Streptomyces sp. NPDC088194]|uniref:thiolase family protein n=1 Tax=Streptomyces sp. NPDC088194 TaxID=3154931 RepID=UPI003450D787
MSTFPRDVYVVDAVRTPVGRYGGALAAVRPDDLAAHAIRELLARTPALDPALIGDVYLGNANGAGEENRNVGRMAGLLAGLPVTVPGVTVNRLCASGLEAVVQAARAWQQGLFDDETVPVPVPRRKGAPVVVDRDESVRADASAEAMAALKPSFRAEEGTVTAGNASPLNDGAAALLLVDEDGLKATGREPLARIRATGVSAVAPHYFGLAPVEAVNRALARAGRTFDDLTTLELNEAFAAQVLGCVAEWPAFDPAILNPRGGALAIGHPLGASGARLAGSVAHQLKAAGSGTGVAALCIGVGQGLALVLER